MKDHDRRVLFSAQRTSWRTPAGVVDALRREFGELFDVSWDHDGHFDAFTDSWPEKVYANPPYGPQVFVWLSRCLEESPELAIFLLPARTDTRWFHELVLPNAKEVRFIKGRLRFDDQKGDAPFPSMVVVF